MEKDLVQLNLRERLNIGRNRLKVKIGYDDFTQPEQQFAQTARKNFLDFYFRASYTLYEHRSETHGF